MFRSVVAVFAGYFTTAVLIVIATIVFAFLLQPVDETTGELSTAPTTAFIVVNLVYGALFAAFGGFVTSWVAACAKFNHVLVLAGFTFLMSLLTFIQRVPEQPLWYCITLVILGPLSVVAGGYLHSRRTGRNL